MDIFFLKKVIRKFGRRKFVSVPPNSARGLRLWLRYTRVCWTFSLVYVIIVYMYM